MVVAAVCGWHLLRGGHVELFSRSLRTALPLVLVFMLLLVNREELMGDQVNGPAFNAVAWVTTVVMILLTALLVANGFGLKLGTG